MVFCSNCQEDVEVDIDEQNGFSCCTSCGQVLDEVAFSNEVTFTKGAGGVSQADGQFVSDAAASRALGRISGGRMYGYQLDSRERSQAKGRAEITHLVDRLRIQPRDDSIEQAARTYTLALSKNFTRGRRTALVAAACLYIVCREDNKPFMLIDFSDALQINVFTLGAVFLQLCKTLRLETQAAFNRPVDPSLYLHRFADKLVGLAEKDKRQPITETATRLVASMKRDWLQTGRRPSGICGAALFIAAHIHGCERSKRDVVNVVHIGEATLAKRVKEFSHTASSELTVEEFEARARELKAAQEAMLTIGAPAPTLQKDGGCPHVRESKEVHFAHSMCKVCYESFLEVSGGMLCEGANPPAFAAAEAQALQVTEGECERLALPGLDEGDEDADLEQQMDALLHQDSGMGKYTKALELVAKVDAETAKTKAKAARAGVRAAKAGGKRARAGGKRAKADDVEEAAEVEQQQQEPEAPRTRSRLKQPSRGGRGRFAGKAAQVETPGEDAAAADASQEDAAAAMAAAAAKTSQPEQAPSAAAAAGGPPAPAAQEEPAAETEAPAAAAAAEGGPAPEAAATAERQLVTTAAPAQPAEQTEDDVLSDMDEDEAGLYLHTKEESKLKEVIWTELNKDYLEKMSAKRAAADAARAKEAALRAAASASESQDPNQPPKKRGRGRPLGSKTKPRPEDTLEPSETAEEATRRMLDAKKLSSKINYNVLAGLFDSGAGAGTSTDAAAAAAPGGAASKDAAPRMGAGAAQQMLGILKKSDSRALGGLRDFHPVASSGQKRKARFAPTLGH